MPKTKAKDEDEELEDLEDLDEETEELEDDEPEEKPAKSKKGGSDEVTFGVADLCAYIKEETGKEYSTRDMRTLLRKMAREDKPRVNREVIPGNRARYDWPDGPKDPEVKRVLKAVNGGEVEAGRKEALEKLKENKKAKDAAKGDASEKKSKKSKK
jgi:hypothetical protein